MAFNLRGWFFERVWNWHRTQLFWGFFVIVYVHLQDCFHNVYYHHPEQKIIFHYRWKIKFLSFQKSRTKYRSFTWPLNKKTFKVDTSCRVTTQRHLVLLKLKLGNIMIKQTLIFTLAIAASATSTYWEIHNNIFSEEFALNILYFQQKRMIWDWTRKSPMYVLAIRISRRYRDLP